jgi:gliding motility-associated-like protein/uncharacterized repeat protein (TIGR01451 family)
MKYLYAILILPQLLFSQVPVSINSGNPAFPFPQFAAYEYAGGHKLDNLANKNPDGLPHAEMEKRIREAWLIMSNAFVYDAETYAGVKYIKSNIGCPYDCTEGAGYAMIAAAYMGDKTMFDGIWFREHDIRMVKKPRYRDGVVPRLGYSYGDNSLAEPPRNPTDPDDKGGDSATDGDVDVALGLLMAWKQWGENSGYIASNGTPISYKQEALNVIRGLVELKDFDLSTGCDAVTGDVGFDGYVKNGNSQGEITSWALSQNPCPEGGKVNEKLHVDYVAPAYFKEFAKFLETQGDPNDKIWNIPQFLRAEASSDWFMGQLYNQDANTVPIAGWVELDAANKATFSNDDNGEDFRYAWRTILNNTWHGDPTVTWNPTTHQTIAGGNSFNKDMGNRFSKFLANPGIAGNACEKVGGDLAMTFQGPSQLMWRYNVNTGASMGTFPLNWVAGTGSPSAVSAQDFDLMGKLFRQCAIEWDQISGTNLDSKPKYFHGFFRLMGMLVLTGNFEAPMTLTPEANIKIYNKVDKTVAFTGDQVTFTYSYRNYGSVAAKNVVITDKIPTELEFVSASGGTNTGGTVTWNVGTVAGFTSTGGIAPTIGEVTVTCRVPKGVSGRVCNQATITTSNGKGWTSNEFPNNLTAVMERNCVDIIEKALEIKKTVDYKKVNPGDVVTYTVTFKNSSKGGYINGGRSGINFAYARSADPANGSTQGIKVRLYHGAAEPYINYENYRISLYLNDNTNNCSILDPGCTNGWGLRNSIYDGGDRNGVKISQENIIPGSDAKGAWNQRMIIQFADQLCGPTPHLLRYYGKNDRIHEGGLQPLRAVWDLFASNNGSVDWSDDWSWNKDATDLSDGRYYPITNDWTDYYKPNKPVTIYHNEACEKPTKTIDNVLVEEWDGYTWRRVFGTGPVPGRDVQDVVVTDIIPKGFTFVEFVGDNPLGILPTTTKLADGTTQIQWKTPKLQIGQEGILKYKVRADFSSGACPRVDEIQTNNASILAKGESAIKVSQDVTVTCTPVILPPAPSSMTKIATPSNIKIGDEIVYKLSYKNTDGSPIEVDFANASDWTAQSGPKMTVAPGGVTSVVDNKGNGVTTYNYSHGTNGTLEATIKFQEYAAFGFAMRHKGGVADNGSYVVFKPNGGGKLETVVYNGALELKRTTLSYSNPTLDIKIILSGNQMNLWVGNTTNPTPSWVVTGLNVQAGNCGFINGFVDGKDNYGIHQVTRFKTSMDSAFNVQITDPIPTDVSFVTAADNGLNTAGVVTYPIVPGPVLANETISYSWTALSKSCPASTSTIVNLGYTNILGVPKNSIAAQALVNCSSTNPCAILPDAPIAADAVLCLNSTPPKLDTYVTALPSATLTWYTDATIVTGSTTTPTLSTATIATANYYVTQTVGTCESLRTKVTVQVTDIPLEPVVKASVSYCQNDTANPLTATALTGATLFWYDTLTSIASIPAPTPVTAALGSKEYFVSQKIGTCESLRAKITVDIVAPPLEPVTKPLSYCQYFDAPVLTATAINGASLLWYTTINGVTGSATAPKPVTTLDGTIEYFVSQKIGNCESPKATLTVTITKSPDAPIIATTPLNYCEGETAPALTALGNNLLWYTTPSGGTGSIMPPTPDTAKASNKNYYVTQTVNTCESKRAEIVVNVIAKPATPIVTPTVSYCKDATNATALTATALAGATLFWYDTLISPTNIPAPTPVTTELGSKEYFVSQKIGNCESQRAKITVDIIAPPLKPTVATTPLTYCQYFDAPALTATATTGASLLWYTDASDITGEATAPKPDTTLDGKTDYFVSQIIGNCESPRAIVTVTITKLPDAPIIATTPLNYCETETAPALTALGDNLLWYTTASGGTGSAIAPTPDTAKAGSKSYYVTQTVGTCESKRVEIVVNVKPPIKPDFSDGVICIDEIAPILEATSPNGISGTWNPATVNNTATASYLFTPNLGQCASSQTITFTVNKSVKINATWTVDAFSENQSVAITATPPGNYTYELDGVAQASSVFENVKPGTISLIVSGNDKCYEPFVGEVLVVNYPKFFTPNSDGYNDNWNIYSLNTKPDTKIFIYDRFGKLLKQLTPLTIGWDGNFNGAQLPATDYWFTVNYNDAGQNKTFKSHFTLKR